MEPKIKITGFGCKHVLKGDDGTNHKFTQQYRYITVTCPGCKNQVNFLYPAINRCHKCNKIFAFCAINERGGTQIGIWSAKWLTDVELEVPK
jgi:phage FluMu protein Com